jgi:hypothetical protein
MGHTPWKAMLCLITPALIAQQAPRAMGKKPYQAQSPSTFTYRLEDQSEVVEISNVAYEVVGQGIPGRPPNERLVLRKSTRTKHVIDDIGMEASTTVEAWPLGVDFKQKPVYSMTIDGVDPTTVNSDLFVVSRGLEETEWWSVYKLGSGAHLFDTYVPLVQFSISREVQTLRYVGLEVPPDDIQDARLKAPNVVAVVTYASAERVIREALVTCDDAKQAALLRSFADSSRTVSYAGRSLRIAISQNYPSQPETATIAIPVTKDDLELSRIQAPAAIHVTAWKR